MLNKLWVSNLIFTSAIVWGTWMRAAGRSMSRTAHCPLSCSGRWALWLSSADCLMQSQYEVYSAVCWWSAWESSGLLVLLLGGSGFW